MINILNNARDELIKIKDYDNRYIFIDLYKEGGFIIVNVKDNAGGLSDDVIDRVFEPYFTTKHQSQGTGIGLYMSEEIVYSLLKNINPRFFFARSYSPVYTHD